MENEKKVSTYQISYLHMIFDIVLAHKLININFKILVFKMLLMYFLLMHLVLASLTGLFTKIFHLFFFRKQFELLSICIQKLQ